tara:strand:- start:5250 stop:5423 length:174 start_codon:yes stop_codon:yes gene_type:complete
MPYFGKHTEHKFNESNPFILRRKAKEEQRRRQEEIRKAQEEAKKQDTTEDITHDPDE